MVQEPLFDEPERALPLKRIAPSSDKPRWYPYRNRKRQLCDDCVDLYTEGGPLPCRAAWVRKRSLEERFLCIEHAQHWRDMDRKDDGSVSG